MTIVQYIVINWDVVASWNRGAVIAQACHASTAAIIRFIDRDETKVYTSPSTLPNMTKIILKASTDEFKTICKLLQDNNVEAHCWVEQPERVETCLALRPYKKTSVSHFFAKLPLLK